jgi:hypothetical protein
MENLKHILFILAGIASFLAFSSFKLNGQATATGHVTAEIVEAITAVETAPMTFGRVFTPATFSVSGARDVTFAVILPEFPTLLNGSGGSGSLSVSGWTATPGDGADSFILSGGTLTVRVGATLQAGPVSETPKGFYSGTYQVTFSYN